MISTVLSALLLLTSASAEEALCCPEQASVGCSFLDVQEYVCLMDSYCCTTQWDYQCEVEGTKFQCTPPTTSDNQCGVGGCMPMSMYEVLSTQQRLGERVFSMKQCSGDTYNSIICHKLISVMEKVMHFAFLNPDPGMADWGVQRGAPADHPLMTAVASGNLSAPGIVTWVQSLDGTVLSADPKIRNMTGKKDAITSLQSCTCSSNDNFCLQEYQMKKDQSFAQGASRPITFKFAKGLKTMLANHQAKPAESAQRTLAKRARRAGRMTRSGNARLWFPGEIIIGVGCEVGVDIAVDAAVDASIDAAIDAGTDAAADAAVDGAGDAATDAATDAAGDAATDDAEGEVADMSTDEITDTQDSIEDGDLELGPDGDIVASNAAEAPLDTADVTETADTISSDLGDEIGDSLDEMDSWDEDPDDPDDPDDDDDDDKCDLRREGEGCGKKCATADTVRQECLQQKAEGFTFSEEMRCEGECNLAQCCIKQESCEVTCKEKEGRMPILAQKDSFCDDKACVNCKCVQTCTFSCNEKAVVVTTESADLGCSSKEDCENCVCHGKTCAAYCDTNGRLVLEDSPPYCTDKTLTTDEADCPTCECHCLKHKSFNGKSCLWVGMLESLLLMTQAVVDIVFQIECAGDDKSWSWFTTIGLDTVGIAAAALAAFGAYKKQVRSCRVTDASWYDVIGVALNVVGTWTAVAPDYWACLEGNSSSRALESPTLSAYAPTGWTSDTWEVFRNQTEDTLADLSMLTDPTSTTRMINETEKQEAIDAFTPYCPELAKAMVADYGFNEESANRLQIDVYSVCQELDTTSCSSFLANYDDDTLPLGDTLRTFTCDFGSWRLVAADIMAPVGVYSQEATLAERALSRVARGNEEIKEELTSVVVKDEAKAEVKGSFEGCFKSKLGLCKKLEKAALLSGVILFTIDLALQVCVAVESNTGYSVLAGDLMIVLSFVVKLAGARAEEKESEESGVIDALPLQCYTFIGDLFGVLFNVISLVLGGWGPCFTDTAPSRAISTQLNEEYLTWSQGIDTYLSDYQTYGIKMNATEVVELSESAEGCPELQNLINELQTRSYEDISQGIEPALFVGQGMHAVCEEARELRGKCEAFFGNELYLCDLLSVQATEPTTATVSRVITDGLTRPGREGRGRTSSSSSVQPVRARSVKGSSSSSRSGRGRGLQSTITSPTPAVPVVGGCQLTIRGFCGSIPEGTVYTGIQYQEKGGNDGTVSCDTFCTGGAWGTSYSISWGTVYAQCVAAYNTVTEENVHCDDVPGLITGGELQCYCTEPAVEEGGDNGSVDCETYCTGSEWPPVYGGCVAAYNTATGLSESCSFSSLLAPGEELICYCTDGPTDTGSKSAATLSVFDKGGDNGSVDCNTYCTGKEWLPEYEECVSAFNTATGEEVSCDTTPGSQAEQLTCYCSNTPEYFAMSVTADQCSDARTNLLYTCSAVDIFNPEAVVAMKFIPDSSYTYFLLKTGCTNDNPSPMLLSQWYGMSITEAQQNMYNICEAVRGLTAGATTPTDSANEEFCCGHNTGCLVTKCTLLTDYWPTASEIAEDEQKWAQATDANLIWDQTPGDISCPVDSSGDYECLGQSNEGDLFGCVFKLSGCCEQCTWKTLREAQIQCAAWPECQSFWGSGDKWWARAVAGPVLPPTAPAGCPETYVKPTPTTPAALWQPATSISDTYINLPNINGRAECYNACVQTKAGNSAYATWTGCAWQCNGCYFGTTVSPRSQSSSDTCYQYAFDMTPGISVDNGDDLWWSPTEDAFITCTTTSCLPANYGDYACTANSFGCYWDTLASAQYECSMWPDCLAIVNIDASIAEYYVRDSTNLVSSGDGDYDMVDATAWIPVPVGTIQVESATYGQNCVGFGVGANNALWNVADNCDGKVACDYTVDVTTLTDPAPGCGKQFVVVYACAGENEQPRVVSLPAGANTFTLSLTCATTGGVKCPLDLCMNKCNVPGVWGCGSISNPLDKQYVLPYTCDCNLCTEGPGAKCNSELNGGWDFFSYSTAALDAVPLMPSTTVATSYNCTMVEGVSFCYWETLEQAKKECATWGACAGFNGPANGPVLNLPQKKVGYVSFSADCPGNNINSYTADLARCEEYCANDVSCMGFSYSQSTYGCITKSATCTSSPIGECDETNTWCFFQKTSIQPELGGTNSFPPIGYQCPGCQACGCDGSGDGVDSCGDACCATSPTNSDGTDPCWSACPAGQTSITGVNPTCVDAPLGYYAYASFPYGEGSTVPVPEGQCTLAFTRVVNPDPTTYGEDRPCTGNWDAKVGDDVCCGQSGTVASTSDICPTENPVCYDYAVAGCFINITGTCTDYPGNANIGWFDDSDYGGPAYTTSAACVTRQSSWESSCGTGATVNFDFNGIDVTGKCDKGLPCTGILRLTQSIFNSMELATEWQYLCGQSEVSMQVINYLTIALNLNQIVGKAGANWCTIAGEKRQIKTYLKKAQLASKNYPPCLASSVNTMEAYNLPAGSYTATCQDCALNYNQNGVAVLLTCTCQNDYAQLANPSTINDCFGQPTNINGVLTCSLPSGGYQNDCTGCQWFAPYSYMTCDACNGYTGLNGDCGGNNIVSYSSSTVAECATYCTEDAQCAGFSWSGSGTQCITKSASCSTPALNAGQTCSSSDWCFFAKQPSNGVTTINVADCAPFPFEVNVNAAGQLTCDSEQGCACAACGTAVYNNPLTPAICDAPIDGSCNAQWGAGNGACYFVGPANSENNQCSCPLIYIPLQADCPGNNIGDDFKDTLADCKTACNDDASCAGVSFSGDTTKSKSKCYKKSATCSEPPNTSTNTCNPEDNYCFYEKSSGS